MAIPENLQALHVNEEFLRKRSLEVVADDERLQLHFRVIEACMDLLDTFRQVDSADEDVKVLQMLALRLFNALAAATKLLLSGYYLFSTQILRDILETAFLVDLFSTDAEALTQWRTLESKKRRKQFSPVKVRSFLDERDGFTTKKRAEQYDLISELAGHPTMMSVRMLRPKHMDARNTPFVDSTALEAVGSELGRLAVQVGGTFLVFAARLKDASVKVIPSAKAFTAVRREWVEKFYPGQHPL